MALQAVGQQAGRQALATPVMHHHAEVTHHQVAHHLVIFLDRFGTARRHEDRAARNAEAGIARRRPEAEAQAQAAGATEPFAQSAFRHTRFRREHQRSTGRKGGDAAHDISVPIIAVS